MIVLIRRRCNNTQISRSAITISMRFKTPTQSNPILPKTRRKKTRRTRRTARCLRQQVRVHTNRRSCSRWKTATNCKRHSQNSPLKIPHTVDRTPRVFAENLKCCKRACAMRENPEHDAQSSLAQNATDDGRSRKRAKGSCVETRQSNRFIEGYQNSCKPSLKKEAIGRVPPPFVVVVVLEPFFFSHNYNYYYLYYLIQRSIKSSFVLLSPRGILWTRR